MSVTINGVVATELDGSPIEKLEAGKFSATMKFKCDWADRHDLMNGLVYSPGFSYPHSLRGAYCSGASCKKLKPNLKMDEVDISGNGYASYEFAEVTAEFRTPDYITPEPTGPNNIMMTENEEPAVHAVSLDYRKYQWVAGTGPTVKPLLSGEAPFKQVFGSEYVITHHDIPNSDIGVGYTVHSAVESFFGKVNNAPENARTLVARTFAAETLLCKPTLRNTQGAYTSFTYRFAYNPEGWNKFWRGDTQAWESMYLLGTSTEVKNFPLVDMSTLFDA